MNLTNKELEEIVTATAQEFLKDFNEFRQGLIGDITNKLSNISDENLRIKLTSAVIGELFCQQIAAMLFLKGKDCVSYALSNLTENILHIIESARARETDN